MTREIDLGILFSRSGTYRLLSEASRTGALKAVEQVNADDSLDVRFNPIERDPAGNIDAYAPLCEEILRDSSARHVIGCTTSWSRKEVIPALERMDGVLWYPTPYEGFEASDRIVYSHACPNQHLLPLLDYAFSQFGRRSYLTGSNYIWGWEMNRLAREIGARNGGEVLGERYLPLGSTEIERIVEEIADLRPDFVLNQLIGPSQYAFLAAIAKLRQLDPFFRAGHCPVLSCNLTECELPTIGPSAEEVISAGPWFRGLHPALPGNGEREDFGSSLEAAAHASVMMLAGLLSSNPGAEYLSLQQLLAQPRAARIGISARTHHVSLPVAIAQVREGAFVPLWTEQPVEGDPYLTREREPAAVSLRVVK
ncbi:transporter substrate-binding protein [Tropicimonas sediminicola]|uniref:Amino acid/amide ABC transporter substrate-binding protein, HAAT family n=1 Tax=Tropicimonas sediminicola TaxID=1031541 RepID=A0A239KSX0_9RHOB|nr:transporter substrate-binding protein [Tropicimonas sediminicola]SNT21446.1 amino acid/amide ABC transporter substrate-binding protein, HAAT family [Tropicimonas sediminicola]